MVESGAQRLTGKIVDWLSQEVVLRDDDYEAVEVSRTRSCGSTRTTISNKSWSGNVCAQMCLQFFQQYLSEESVRFLLARLYDTLKDGVISWKAVEGLTELMVEDESRLNPHLVGLVQIQALITDMESEQQGEEGCSEEELKVLE